mmetsp:Transcript_30121/g.99583  ORF Transcript_30121/g.99583 Transcript_30121/m.99583 type:complete len:357 (+) Transcript_30121:3433-4503(+)
MRLPDGSCAGVYLALFHGAHGTPRQCGDVVCEKTFPVQALACARHEDSELVHECHGNPLRHLLHPVGAHCPLAHDLLQAPGHRRLVHAFRAIDPLQLGGDASDDVPLGLDIAVRRALPLHGPRGLRHMALPVLDGVAGSQEVPREVPLLVLQISPAWVLLRPHHGHPQLGYLRHAGPHPRRPRVAGCGLGGDHHQLRPDPSALEALACQCVQHHRRSLGLFIGRVVDVRLNGFGLGPQHQEHPALRHLRLRVDGRCRSGGAVRRHRRPLQARALLRRLPLSPQGPRSGAGEGSESHDCRQEVLERLHRLRRLGQSRRVVRRRREQGEAFRGLPHQCHAYPRVVLRRDRHSHAQEGA